MAETMTVPGNSFVDTAASSNLMERKEFDDVISNNEAENNVCISPIVSRSEVEVSVENDVTKSAIETRLSNHNSCSDRSISETETPCHINDCSKDSRLEFVVDRLSSGLLTSVLPQEERLKKQFNDIIQSQNVIIETIEHENCKFQEAQLIKEVADIMDRARTYQVKLTNIKKDMMSLHEKTTQLKRRALKLQQQKQKEALQKEQQRDEELEQEKKLMAKVILRKQ